jgi:arsenate reductase-like glutaredoxin family protein
MSQSRFLQEEYSKKYRQAANNAAINSAITDLVAARNVRHADGSKRLIKSSNSYKNVIASLQSAGVNITYDAIMKRVSRASVEDIITEIRSTNTSTEVSSLSSPREQADDDSLTSEKMAETTLHNDHSLGTPELKSGVGGRPKGSTKAKKKKDY